MEKTNKYAQIPEMRTLTASNFKIMDAEMQYELLGDSWKNISCKEFEPVLEKIIQDHQKISQNPKSPSVILEYAKLRLLQLQGKDKEAMEFVFTDLKRPYNNFDWKIFLSFPDEPLPGMDEELLRCLKEKQGTLYCSLIGKYATSKILPDVVEFIGKNKDNKSGAIDIGELFAYRMKYQKESVVKDLQNMLVNKDSFRVGSLFRTFPDEAGELYLYVIGKADEEDAKRFLIELAYNGNSKCIDGMLDAFEKFSEKPVEGFRKSGEFRDFGRRVDFLEFLLANQNMQFSRAQKDRLFALLTPEERVVYEEAWMNPVFGKKMVEVAQGPPEKPKVSTVEAQNFEPVKGKQAKVGVPFVAGKDGALTQYSDAADVKVSIGQGGVPELTVDPFPDKQPVKNSKGGQSGENKSDTKKTVKKKDAQ